MRESLTTFQRDVKNNLTNYFEEGKGVVPKSIDDIFGEGGTLASTFQRFFDPDERNPADC